MIGNKTSVHFCCSSPETEHRVCYRFWHKGTLRKKVEQTVPLWRMEPFFSLIIMFRKKMAPPSEVAPFFRRKQHQNSATGGAELHTMKRLQGWSRFGSTFFSVKSVLKWTVMDICGNEQFRFSFSVWTMIYEFIKLLNDKCEIQNDAINLIWWIWCGYYIFLSCNIEIFHIKHGQSCLQIFYYLSFQCISYRL